MHDSNTRWHRDPAGSRPVEPAWWLETRMPFFHPYRPRHRVTRLVAGFVWALAALAIILSALTHPDPAATTNSTEGAGGELITSVSPHSHAHWGRS